MSFNVDVNGLRPYRNYKVLKLKQMRPDSEECLRPYRNYKVLKRQLALDRRIVSLRPYRNYKVLKLLLVFSIFHSV